MKKFLFLSYFFFLILYCFSQKESNNWYFGDHAGINFNPASPVAVTNGALFASDQTSSLSDSLGNLIMYSNGASVWNRNHIQMPNGNNLMGSGLSASHASIIAQKPGSSNLYYIFGVAFGVSVGLQYSIVDMSLQGGDGDVISKNNLLVQPVCEKLTAVKHKNGTDIWIITHLWDSDAFYAYLLTSSGISSPVITHIGTVHQGGSQPGYNAQGQLTASTDGSKLALAIYDMGYFEIYDFDNFTGIVTNPIQISGYNTAWGVQFSTNGKKLYANQWYYNYDVKQFDMQAGSASAIANSVKIIGTTTSPDPNYKGGFMQLAPDGRIYIAKYTSPYVAVINHPNAPGTSCGFIDDGFYLAGKTSNAGLPNFIQTYLYNPGFTFQNTCLGDTMYFHLFKAANADSVLWNFDDPGSGANNSSHVFNPNHIFSSPGNYDVMLISYEALYPDTFQQTVTAYPLPQVNLGNDTSICIGNQVTFDAGSGYSSYNWNTGSSSSSISVSDSGTYTVTVTNTSGCTSTDSIHLSVGTNFIISIGNDTSICKGNQITFTAGSGYASYIWSIGSTVPSITISDSGTYSVTVTDNSGCPGTASINLSINSTPVVFIGNDTSICKGNQITFTAGSGYAFYIWNIGSTVPSITISDSGTYSVTVTDNSGCPGTASINLSINSTPVVFIGNDTSICNNDILILNAGSVFKNYLWNNGDTTPSTIASTNGFHSITVSDSFGCTGSDSLYLTVNPNPIVNLGNDFKLCAGENVILDAGDGNNNYHWQDGSTNESFKVIVPGTYWVEVINNNGCKQSDTLTVSQGSDSTDIFIPNVFTPNGDGYNDKFEIKYLDISDANLKVYNRWGNLLYENRGTAEFWDGTYKGTICSDGVYFWIIEYQTNCNRNTGMKYKTGVVTLLK